MAIYPSINLSPQSTAVDTSINQNFTFIVAGSPITDYQIKIWDMGVIPNTLVHTSAKVALSPNRTNGDTVTHSLTGGTIVVNKKYKWQVETWSGATSAVSRQVVFESYTTPTISLTISSPVTTQSLSLTGVYAQAQSIPINSYTYELYDSADVLLESTGTIYGFSAVHTFTGLSTGSTYKVKLYGENQKGMTFNTGLVSFNVVYTQAVITVQPTATIDDNTSLINVEWAEIVQILGTPTGTPSYPTGLAQDGGKALALDSGEIADWTFDIPLDFTCQFMIKIPTGVDGVRVQLKTGYYFGYELGKFYTDINGVKVYSLNYDVAGKIFFIILRPTNVTIKEFEKYWLWDNYKTDTWLNVAQKTWNDVYVKYNI